MSIGAKIAEARKAAGLSQKELAGKVKISPQYLNDIEHGKRNPGSEDLIEALSKALNLDAAVLYYLAGRLPSSHVTGGVSDQKVVEAFKAFRRTLKK